MPTGAQTAFFSYSRDDSEFALRLAADLKAAGANVWLDQLDIEPGQRWAQTVQDALNNCQRLLVILSPSSVSSTNVDDEVAFALEEHKTVIPVFYRDCKVPFRLRPFQYVDFRTDYDRGLKTLLKTLGVEQSAAAGGGAAVSAVPKDTAADVSDADEREPAAEQHRLAQEEEQSTEQARPAAQDLERLATDEKVRLFLSKKKMMIGSAVGVVVLLLVWILWPRGSNNQASQPQTAGRQPQSTEQAQQGTGQPQPPAADVKKPVAKNCPGGVYCDPDTNLMWTIEDNGKDINWPDAGQYCKNLTLAGLSGWELPTIDELEKLDDPTNPNQYKIREPFRLTHCCPWSSTKQRSDSAWGFNFFIYGRSPYFMVRSTAGRALCVRRSGK